jgi:glycerophosphoryl diester phosphodiesterase
MTRGVKAGAQGIEFDVHLSKDGQVVLAHDEALDRTTSHSGRLADHSLEELRSFDAAYWWVEGEVDDHHAPAACYTLRAPEGQPPSPESRIPTLDEVLDRFDEPLTIEIKDQAAAEPLVRRLRDRGVPPERMIVTSFSDDIVRQVRCLASELRLAPGWRWTARFFLRTRLRCRPRQSPYVAVQVPRRYDLAETLPRQYRPIARLVPYRLRSFTVVDKRFVAAAHACGMAVHVWTVDDEDEMRELITLPVDGIMTDRPSILTDVLGPAAARTGSRPT